jgi:hypothetical protein
MNVLTIFDAISSVDPSGPFDMTSRAPSTDRLTENFHGAFDPSRCQAATAPRRAAAPVHADVDREHVSVPQLQREHVGDTLYADSD